MKITVKDGHLYFESAPKVPEEPEAEPVGAGAGVTETGTAGDTITPARGKSKSGGSKKSKKTT